MYRDVTRTTEERVEDLLGRMTLEEKVARPGGASAMTLLGHGGLDTEKLNAVLQHGIGQASLVTLAMLEPRDLAEAVNALQGSLVSTPGWASRPSSTLRR